MKVRSSRPGSWRQCLQNADDIASAVIDERFARDRIFYEIDARRLRIEGIPPGVEATYFRTLLKLKKRHVIGK